MLPVNVQKKRCHLPESGRSHGPVIDPAGAPLGGNPPGDDDAAVLIRLRSDIPEGLQDFLPVGLKHQLNQGVIRPLPDHLLRCLLTQRHVHGTDDDGLTRTGFSGEDIESFPEFHMGAVDQSQVFYMKFKKQFFLPPIIQSACGSCPSGRWCRPACGWRT